MIDASNRLPHRSYGEVYVLSIITRVMHSVRGERWARCLLALGPGNGSWIWSCVVSSSRVWLNFDMAISSDRHSTRQSACACGSGTGMLWCPHIDCVSYSFLCALTFAAQVGVKHDRTWHTYLNHMSMKNRLLLFSAVSASGSFAPEDVGCFRDPPFIGMIECEQAIDKSFTSLNRSLQ
jgi:hypothetical protein